MKPLTKEMQPHMNTWRIAAWALLAAPGMVYALAAPGAVSALPGATPAQTEEGIAAAIEQALDEKIDISLPNRTIRSALDELGNQTGVRIVVERSALPRLPYGEQTQVNAQINDVTLRDALRALLTPIGLEFEVRRDALHVSATPPLRRIVRRATWDELDTIRRLYTTPWSDELWASLPVQFQDTAMEDKSARDAIRELGHRAGAGTAAEVLELSCNQKHWTWYPSGKMIVILPQTQQVLRQLNRRVSLRFFNTPLSDVLLDLGREADVLVRMEPGALASVPAQAAQAFSLNIENVSVQQALEVVSGTTGLGYTADEKGIRIEASRLGATVAPPSTTSASDLLKAMQANPIVGMLTLKGENGVPDFSFFVRESDLPPNLNEARKQKLDAAIKAFELSLEKPGAEVR